MISCDGNYGLGAYGMDSVHSREPERSRVTIWCHIMNVTNGDVSNRGKFALFR